jgi:hypothetical protein
MRRIEKCRKMHAQLKRLKAEAEEADEVSTRLWAQVESLKEQLYDEEHSVLYRTDLSELMDRLGDSWRTVERRCLVDTSKDNELVSRELRHPPEPFDFIPYGKILIDSEGSAGSAYLTWARHTDGSVIFRLHYGRSLKNVTGLLQHLMSLGLHQLAKVIRQREISLIRTRYDEALTALTVAESV